MISIMRQKLFVETGGPLIGFFENSKRIVIVDLTDSGPKSKQSMFGVEIDGEHSQRFCDEMYQSSNGVYDYMGDWHCHPSFSLSPSEPDREAISLMASVDGIVDNPVSLIASRFTKKIHSYVWDGYDLIRVKLSLEE
jgi:integrative and conjugative element protein (TIGR02256 family)